MNKNYLRVMILAALLLMLTACGSKQVEETTEVMTTAPSVETEAATEQTIDPTVHEMIVDWDEVEDLSTAATEEPTEAEEANETKNTSASTSTNKGTTTGSKQNTQKNNSSDKNQDTTKETTSGKKEDTTKETTSDKKDDSAKETTPSKEQDETKPTAPATEPVVTEPNETQPEEETTETEASVTDYEWYMSLSASEQEAYFNSFDSIEAFVAWLNNAQAEYEAAQEQIEIEGGSSIDIGKLVEDNS